jgi:hypothetical protein
MCKRRHALIILGKFQRGMSFLLIKIRHLSKSDLNSHPDA